MTRYLRGAPPASPTWLENPAIHSDWIVNQYSDLQKWTCGSKGYDVRPLPTNRKEEQLTSDHACWKRGIAKSQRVQIKPQNSADMQAQAKWALAGYA